MHFNSNLRKGALFMAVSALLFTAACKQAGPDNLKDGDDNGGYASDISRVEWVNNDVISIVDAAGTVYNGAYMRTTGTTLSGCATVGTDTVVSPHKLIIRFGDVNCVCQDGRKRRGSIIVTYDGQYFDTNAVHTITYDRYFVNDNELTGSVKTVRIDTTITGNWFYQVTVNDSLNMSQDPLQSQYVVWTGNLVRKWIGGATTGDRNDDVFSISGAATLTRANGHIFSCAISTPLQFAVNCDYAESGVVNVNGYNGTRRLDYGTGTCDAAAKLYIDVNSFPLTIVK